MRYQFNYVLIKSYNHSTMAAYAAVHNLHNKIIDSDLWQEDNFSKFSRHTDTAAYEAINFLVSGD